MKEHQPCHGIPQPSYGNGLAKEKLSEAGIERDGYRKAGQDAMENVCCSKQSDGLTSFPANVALQIPQPPVQLIDFSFHYVNESLFLCCFTIMGTFTPRAILWSEHWASKQKIQLSRGFGVDACMCMNQLAN